jgi:cyclohexanecarboxylate-CoA ligase
LPGRLASICRDGAGRVALVDGDRSLTFHDVAMLVERLAGVLTSLGAGPGVVVSWQLPGWWEAAVVHHAALRCGAVPNPLNPIFRTRELRFVLHEARPRILFVPKTFRRFDHAALALKMKQEVSSLEHVVVVRGSAEGALSFDDLVDDGAEAPAIPHRPAVTALLLYTSGTTSDPKGVLHSHETLLYEIDSLRDIHRITGADCYLAGSPVAHIAGLVYGLLMPFALGTRTVLMERWDARAALKLIERERVTFQTGAPAFLVSLAEAHGGGDLASFRLFSTGGAAITTATLRDAATRIGCAVKRAYGSTEVPTLTATRFDDPDDVRVGTDGRVIEPAEMRIALSDGSAAGPGVEGEIWARSPEVFHGYLNPELNAGVFDDAGWFRTGDLGLVDGEGNLQVTGRMKDIIIRGGENISAKEIEDLLAAHPAVADVAVVGVPDTVLGERACAVVVPRNGVSFDFDEMVAFLETHELAKQKLPERLEIRSRLPRSASGKVLKTLLRDELSSGS